MFEAISAAAVGAANTTYHAGIVRQLAISRELLVHACETLREVYARSQTADDLVASAEARLLAISERRSSRGVVHISVALTELMERLNARAEGAVVGVSTGYPDLDYKLHGGLAKGQLVILAARPSMGKAQPLDAALLTPAGFIPMGDVSIGDQIIGSTGMACRVTGIYPQGDMEVFRVTMSDGGSTECTKDHLWFTQTRNERRTGIVGSAKTLGAIMATLTRPGVDIPNHAVPTVGNIQYERTGSPLRIHPYVLGLLLGDGSFGRAVLFSNPEPDIQERLQSLLPLEDRLHVGPNGKDCRISRSQRNNDTCETYKALSYYGLIGKDSYSKFIPSEYLIASVDERISLLRGLMDSDGFVTSAGRSIEFSTSSARLAVDVASLARSLGGIVSTRCKVPTYTYKGEKLQGAESSRMVLCFPAGFIPVSSLKHKAKWLGGNERYHRSIVSVEPAGCKPCQCIKVDAPDSLYVTDDFIVTHNTSLAVDIAAHAAFRSCEPCLFASLEMDRVEIGQRLLSSQARLGSYILEDPKRMNADQTRAIGHVQYEAKTKPLYIGDDPGMSLATICSHARRARSRHNIALVIVDYLQLIESDPELGTNSRQEAVAQISRRLKKLAREIDAPILALSQLNRNPEGRADKRPSLSDLRESGAIEQDADVVLLLYRPEYYDPNDRPGVAEVIVAKNRNGPTGTVKLTFLREFTRFESYREINDVPPGTF